MDLLFNGSYYHLWYMVGIIYSMVLIGLLCKLKLTKMLLPLAVVCYVVGLLGTSYYGVGTRLPVLNLLFDSGWFPSVRRMFLMGFPFTALGWTISEGKLKLRISDKQLLIVTILTALLFAAEIIAVTVTGMARNQSKLQYFFIRFFSCSSETVLLTRLRRKADWLRLAGMLQILHTFGILFSSLHCRKYLIRIRDFCCVRLQQYHV